MGWRKCQRDRTTCLAVLVLGPHAREHAKVFTALVTDPGRGKPKEVDAINRAAYVLLTAHLQGFIDDLHREVGMLVIGNKANDPSAVVKMLGNSRSNPHVQVIDKMFASLGIYDIMNQLNWRNCANNSVKKRLTDALQQRNGIAHGGRASITKANVVQLKEYVLHFADALDSAVRAKSKSVLGRYPW